MHARARADHMHTDHTRADHTCADHMRARADHTRADHARERADQRAKALAQGNTCWHVPYVNTSRSYWHYTWH